MSFQKPFIKWVGGKTQIIHTITDKFPNSIFNYHEIFLGGGSVLFALLTLHKNNKIEIKNKIYAYDINKTLINMFKHVQKNKAQLFEFITKYIKEYDSINGIEIIIKPKTIEQAKTSKESYYYWIRNIFNNIDKDTVESSAIFMFLNKTCFRGIYREGPNGFNVPYGHYKKTPTIITKQELNKVSELIQNVEFIHSDFKNSIKNIKEGDFVYLDPPYAHENKNSFVCYVKDVFDINMHKSLFDEILKFDERKIKFLMSNAKVDFVLKKFKEYTCDEIVARRAINSKNHESTTIEVLIYNN